MLLLVMHPLVFQDPGFARRFVRAILAGVDHGEVVVCYDAKTWRLWGLGVPVALDNAVHLSGVGCQEGF